MSILKRLASYFIVAYLATGITMGALMYASIPAMNMAGWGYYALTWPVFICHGTKACKWTPYVPNWAFTFRSPKDSHNG